MVVVIAGCGDLGTEVGLRLARAGERVVGLRRRAEVLPPPITGRAVDLAQGPVSLPGDTDRVVVATAASERTVTGYRRAYVDGLRHVLDAVDRLPSPPRVLMVSSTAVYGGGDGSWVDEDAPADAGEGTAAVLVEAEQLLRERVPAAVALRLGGIYGPGRDHLVRQVRAGAEIPGTTTWVNLVHRDDAAAAVVHLLGHPEPPTVVNGVDGAPATRGEIVGFLAAELGAPAPVLDADRPGTAGGKRLRSDRLRASGFSFTYPSYREGYRAVLAGEGVRHP